MLFIFPIISVFLGTVLASLTQEELEEGRKYLVLAGIILLSYLIFYVLSEISINLRSILILGASILISLLPFKTFSPSLNEKGAIGAFLQEFSKGVTYFYFSDIDFLFPLMIYSILEGSLLFEDNLKEDLYYMVFSQSFFIIGIAFSHFSKFQPLSAFSIGGFLAVLSRNLFYQFLKGFEIELKKFRSLIR